ncbi:phospholipid phosphatase-related protein type 3-like [Brachionichthys hirsutus]|uniref:phospholipid phosphatase-related protein type 3-like n=1 Tax=Brachionichthys hirsutus TaxID=412623 RepID=UPI003604F6DD
MCSDWSKPKNQPERKPPKDSMTLLPCFYFVELPIVLSSLVSLYFLELTDVLSPATVGFRCYDRDLSMPHVETGDELIPLLMLLSLAFAGPAASMYFNTSISSSTKLLKPLLVFTFCMAAGLAGLTQITQHRSHPVDVYVGYLVGAGIGVYLAVYAVGNFKASDEDAHAAHGLTPAAQKDGLRVLSQRSHGSLYRKTPRTSESREELGAGLGSGARSKVRREKASLASLKRASADVELLAPRGPMGKETMVTFSNTLPRVANGSSPISPSDEPVATQRHMTFHVPFDPQRSRQLVSEWKQRSPSSEQEMPSSLYPMVQANKGVATPPLVHIPEEAARPPPVSPKSAKTRAKWLSLTEGGGTKEPGSGPIAVSTPRVPTQQRVTQVIAMSKQHGHGPTAACTKTSEGLGGPGQFQAKFVLL